jgi:hypothetical protein
MDKEYIRIIRYTMAIIHTIDVCSNRYTSGFLDGIHVCFLLGLGGCIAYLLTQINKKDTQEPSITIKLYMNKDEDECDSDCEEEDKEVEEVEEVGEVEEDKEEDKEENEVDDVNKEVEESSEEPVQEPSEEPIQESSEEPVQEPSEKPVQESLSN